MVIDLSSPVWWFVGVFLAALVLIGFALYVKGILVEAQVEAARRIRAEQDANKPNIGRRI